MAEEIEKIYIIPLKKTGFKSSKAAPTAIKRVKKYLTRHMKVEEEKIWIDDSLNNSLWSHGKYNMATRVRVKAVKFEDGVVEAYLPELEFKKSRRELLREEREKKEPILRKEETGEGEGETDSSKDYDITPTADGDVKIKKKKPTKEKEETAQKETEKKLVKDEKQDEIKEKPKKETSKKKEETSSKKSSLKTKTKKKTANKKE
ncbi:MAG: 50S ribosomal protein L31e [Candidatus Thermoplasmatota archaeon]|nr:50S ribosomal protein L31e [Candidatus Thermoplasmatota archaeon]